MSGNTNEPKEDGETETGTVTFCSDERIRHAFSVLDQLTPEKNKFCDMDNQKCDDLKTKLQAFMELNREMLKDEENKTILTNTVQDYFKESRNDFQDRIGPLREFGNKPLGDDPSQEYYTGLWRMANLLLEITESCAAMEKEVFPLKDNKEDHTITTLLSQFIRK